MTRQLQNLWDDFSDVGIPTVAAFSHAEPKYLLLYSADNISVSSETAHPCWTENMEHKITAY